MKSILRGMCLAASLFSPSAWAAQGLSFSATLSATGTTSSTSVSNGVDGGLLSVNYHTVQVVVTGSPSACTVRLEGSLDGSNWFDVSGTQTCTSSTMFHVDMKPLVYVRANLITFSGGTSPTAVITYRGQN